MGNGQVKRAETLVEEPVVDTENAEPPTKEEQDSTKLIAKLRKYRKGIKTDYDDGQDLTQFKTEWAENLTKDVKNKSHRSHEHLKLLEGKGLVKNKYNFISEMEIGSGSFGTVYQGILTENSGSICIKKMHNNSNQAAVKEIMNEVDVLQNLSHDNIVNFLGYEVKLDSTQQKQFCIYMDYASSSLNQWIRQNDKDKGDQSDFEEIIRGFCEQILQGLTYMHEHKVIHGDIKAANILLTKDLVCKIADFGSAIRHKEEKVILDKLVGSLYWMAPEVIKQNGVSAKSDIWSLGATVYELLTGEPPFFELKGNEFTIMHVIAGTKQLPIMDDSISKDAQHFVYKCLQRDPKLRPSARQLLNHKFIVNAKKKKKRRNRKLKDFQQGGSRVGNNFQIRSGVRRISDMAAQRIVVSINLYFFQKDE